MKQYFSDNCYNTGVEMQDNAARQWWYNTILAVSIILNTGRFAKMVYRNFFNEDGVGILIILTQKLNDCREKSLIEILATKMTNIHFIPSAYNHYFHRLLTAPANASPPKHCFANSNRENAESFTSGWPWMGITAVKLRNLNETIPNCVTIVIC